MAMETRPYIARGGEHAWRGLSAFKDVKIHGFAVKADRKLVHDMLTRYIGEPSQELGLHIDVRGTSIGHVLFMFLQSQRRQVSGNHDKAFRGGHSETLFAVVTLGYRQQPDESWILYAPYVFASDTPGWTADREIYGYPRQLADVSINDDEAGLLTYSISARVIERFGGDSKPNFELIRIKKKSRAEGEQINREQIAECLVSGLGAANVTLSDRFVPRVVAKVQRGATQADHSFFERRATAAKQWKQGRGEIRRSLREQIESHSIPMLFLKQFRDITYADRACYQAILEAPFELGKANKGSVSKDDYELHLNHADSVPIGRELGIPTGQAVPIEFAFGVELDEMRLSAARVISNPYWNPGVEFSTIDEPSRLPMYVDRGGEAVWRQPSMLYGARIFGFGVTVPKKQQQSLLDTFVNNVVKDSNSTYGSKKLFLTPCDGVEKVMLLFVDYEKITSGDPNDSKLGGTTYREFLLMQLAISDDPEFPELDWFIPYICLDTDAPRLGGREIFGYPKQLAKIGNFELFPVANGAIAPARSLHVQTTAFSKSTSAKAGRDVPIVSVTFDEETEKGPPTITPFHAAEDMFLELFKQSHTHKRPVRRVFPISTPASGSGGSAGPGVEVLNALLFTGIGNVFLKEFRDSVKPEKACYQAVCKTDTLPAKFRGGGCIEHPQNYRIRIANVASEPLRDILKESGLYRNEVPAEFAYVLNLDLELTAGRVIANPMAIDVPPDVSVKSAAVNQPPQTQTRRVRRVASCSEPYWRRVADVFEETVANAETSSPALSVDPEKSL